MDVLYIAGYGRSGSTLVERLLDQLPGMTALGELRHFWQRSLLDKEPCSCGLPVSSCPFWSEVLAAADVDVASEATRAATQARRIDRTRNVPWLAVGPGAAKRPELSEHVSRLERLYRAAATVTGTPWLVDSSKEASYAFLLANVPGIRLRVLHLVRDSRAVAFSWTRQKVKPTGDAGHALMSRKPVGVSARRWSYQNLAAEALRTRSECFTRLRYEDFVADPKGTLKRALERLGWPGDLADLPVHGSEAQLAPGHSSQGNPFRFTTGPVTIRADEEWREAMQPGDRRAVTLLTAPLLKLYGYTL